MENIGYGTHNAIIILGSFWVYGIFYLILLGLYHVMLRLKIYLSLKIAEEAAGQYDGGDLED